MPPCAVCQGLYGLVALAPRILWTPDAPAAVDACTESGASAAGTPGGALPTTSPVPAVARCPARARSTTHCSPPASGGGGPDERTALCGRVFGQRPRDEQGAYRRFHPDQGCPANLLEAQPLWHFFTDECPLPPGARERQHGCRRPGAGVERGDEPQPSRHRQRGCRERAPCLWGLAAGAAAGAPRRRGIEFGRDQSHGLPLSGPAPPAAPLPFGPPPVPQPAQHMAGLARLGVQGQGRRMAPYDHVRLLAHRRGHTAALAIAAVGYDDLPGVPAIPF